MFIRVDDREESYKYLREGLLWYGDVTRPDGMVVYPFGYLADRAYWMRREFHHPNYICVEE